MNLAVRCQRKASLIFLFFLELLKKPVFSNKISGSVNNSLKYFMCMYVLGEHMVGQLI